MKIFLITILLSFGVMAEDYETNYEILNPWIREVPPVSKMSAGFVKIKNPSKKDVKLVAVNSDLSKTVELHTHGMVDGVMKMRKVPHINVPAMGEANLKPGGLHIMFINLKKKTIEGEKHNLEFVFSDGTKIKKEAVVK